MLTVANKRHDIVAVTITDPRELELPDVGLVELEDPETLRRYVVDTSDARVRARYAADAAQRIKERNKLFCGAGSIALTCVPTNHIRKAYALFLSRASGGCDEAHRRFFRTGGSVFFRQRRSTLRQGDGLKVTVDLRPRAVRLGIRLPIV